jgi:hypothetical protein
MESTVGIFRSREKAERAIEQLNSNGIDRRRVSLLTPGDNPQKLEAVPTTETEQPGMGKTMGGVVGAALGASSGMMAGTALASLLVPGVGLVFASGVIGAALLVAGGAALGAASGDALEDEMDEGLPRDEVYLYEDALRNGRSVVIVLAEDENQAEAAQKIMCDEGAETLDAAREDWWVGLRDVEELDYAAQGGDFKTDESTYRKGFESALRPGARGKTYDEAAEFISSCYGELCNDRAFRCGYERGHSYDRQLRDDRKEGKQ